VSSLSEIGRARVLSVGKRNGCVPFGSELNGFVRFGTGACEQALPVLGILSWDNRVKYSKFVWTFWFNCIVKVSSMYRFVGGLWG
jgi:hypothetical protein